MGLAGTRLDGFLVDSESITWSVGTKEDAFLVEELPFEITDIQPDPIYIGQNGTLTGAGFGTAQGTGYIVINTATVSDYVSWADTAVVFKTPLASTTGSATVNTSGGSGLHALTLQWPLITSVSPGTVYTGGSFTLTGSRFQSAQADGSSNVYVHDQTCGSITSWAGSKIVANAPTAATNGSVVVTVFNASSNAVYMYLQGTSEWVINGTAFCPWNLTWSESQEMIGEYAQMLGGGLRRDAVAHKSVFDLSWEYLPEQFDGTYYGYDDLRSLGTYAGQLQLKRPVGTSDTSSYTWNVYCNPPEAERMQEASGSNVYWNPSIRLKEA